MFITRKELLTAEGQCWVQDPIEKEKQSKNRLGQDNYTRLKKEELVDVGLTHENVAWLGILLISSSMGLLVLSSNPFTFQVVKPFNVLLKITNPQGKCPVASIHWCSNTPIISAYVQPWTEAETPEPPICRRNTSNMPECTKSHMTFRKVFPLYG